MEQFLAATPDVPRLVFFRSKSSRNINSYILIRCEQAVNAFIIINQLITFRVINFNGWKGYLFLFAL